MGGKRELKLRKCESFVIFILKDVFVFLLPNVFSKKKSLASARENCKTIKYELCLTTLSIKYPRFVALSSKVIYTLALYMYVCESIFGNTCGIVVTQWNLCLGDLWKGF